MAGRGPLPKPDALRQRHNKSRATQLPSAESSVGNDVPELPARKGGWNQMVAEWWSSVWRSPMASEYQDADMRGGLYDLAKLRQDFWTARSAKDRRGLASEIRLQEVRFGLSPADRSRLRWAIEQGETAAERTEARRERKAPKASKDPRAVLKVV